MRTLVIGDIHGSAKALKQVLQLSEFDPTKDKLIQLGDVADGWSQTSECVDVLLDIQNKANDFNKPVFIRGNHDVWVYDWFVLGKQPYSWTTKSGQATIDSYIKSGNIVNEEHLNFWKNQENWYIDDENRLFIHGGWYYIMGFPEGAEASVDAGSIAKECHWDRSLFETAKSAHFMRNHDALAYKSFNALKQFKEVYIGHTQQSSKKHVNYLNLWNLDSGAGSNGKLTIMDVDTKEYWESDLTKKLHTNEKGRN